MRKLTWLLVMAGCVGLGALFVGCRRTSDTSETRVAPQPVELNPKEGSGRRQVFKISFSHAAGAAQVLSAQFLVDKGIVGRMACFVEFFPGSNTLRLMNDEASAWLPVVAAGSPGTLRNKQCSVSAASVSAASHGTELSISFEVTFTEAFQGPKKLFLLSSGPREHSGWKQLGTWTVP